MARLVHHSATAIRSPSRLARILGAIRAIRHAAFHQVIKFRSLRFERPRLTPIFVLLLLALLPRIALSTHVAVCGTYQTCNEIFILKFDATPQYRPEGEPVHVSLHIFEFANWLSTVSTMTFKPFVIGNVGSRVIPGSTVQTFNDGPHMYGSGFNYWFVQNTEWDGVLDWDGLDASMQEVTEPALLTVTVSAGAASVMRAVPVFVTPGKNLGKPLCPVGNPCDPATGNKYQEEIDVIGTAVSPGFTRHYNHMGGTDVGLGVGWTSEYHQQLRPNGDKLTVVRADGRRERLTKSGSSWVADPDSRLKIVSAGAGFTLTLDTGTSETYSALGKLQSVTDRAGNTQTLVYSDGTGGPNGGYIVDANGNATTAVLPANLLIRVIGASGRSLSFRYDANKRVADVTDPAGNSYIYGYDAANNLASVSYPDTTPADRTDNPRRQYLYNETGLTPGDLPHALTGVIDENNARFATWSYDVLGKAASSEHAGGVDKFVFIYSVDPTTGNNTTVVTDARNSSLTYEFQKILDVLKNKRVLQPSGAGSGPAASALTYDANGNIATRTDFNGNQTRYSYDLTRNLETTRTEGLSASGASTPFTRTTQTEWHANFRLPIKLTEAAGKPEQRVTSFSYDPVSGNLLTKTITETATAKTRTWTYSYTSSSDGTLANLIQTEDGPRTDVADLTTYGYYPNGDLKTLTNALGHTTQYSDYDAHGRARLITDPNNLATQLSYTPRGWLKTKTTGTEITTFDYDSVGQLIRVDLSSGQSITYSYDAAHRLTDIQDGLGNRIHYTLDAMSNRIKEETFDAANALVTTHARTFDALNRLWQDIGAVNQTIVYAYDANGNLTGITDALNHKTTHQYDALNRLIKTSDATLKTSQYTYNALDQLLKVTDPRALVTQYSPNAFNQATLEQSPDRANTQYSYDAAGNLKSKTDAKNQTITYAYDALNRLTQMSYPGGVISYSYDQGVNGLGRLSQISDPSGTTSYQYDAHGRITTKTQDSLTLKYSYAPNSGNLASITYPNNRVISYSYTQGRINSIQVDGQPLLNQISYQPFGPVKAWVFGNGRSYSRSFDSDGRLKSYDLNSVVRSLEYDAANRITAYKTPALEQSFAYDDVNRLTSFITNTSTQAYSYDDNGNRSSLTLGTQNYAYSIAPSSNRLSSVAGPSSKTYQYDANGSLINDGQFTFGYDGRGRLTQAGSTGYQLNALGQRTHKQAAFGATRFIYDETGQLLYEVSETAAKNYVYLNDIPVGVLQ